MGKSIRSSARPRPPILAIIFLLVFPLGLLGIAIYQRVADLHPGRVNSPENRQAYTVDMPTLEGGHWKTSDHAGKIVIVNYFATWCGPCREEFPDLAQIATDYGSRGVAVAAVGLDTDAESAMGRIVTLKRFAEAEHPPFPILVPPDLHSQNSEMIPYTYLLDRRGRVAYYFLGRFDAPHLRSLIDVLLKEP